MTSSKSKATVKSLRAGFLGLLVAVAIVVWGFYDGMNFAPAGGLAIAGLMLALVQMAKKQSPIPGYVAVAFSVCVVAAGKVYQAGLVLP